ncbi:alpha/beta hydrolase [Robertkochia marina]|nr:alpha/beta hydrolase [Robertkochia marina]
MRVYNTIILFVLILFTKLNAQDTAWNGQLDVNGLKLQLIFHIEQDDSTRAYLSVPIQGVNKLPADEVFIASDSVSIRFNALQIHYHGQFTDSTHIKGTFTQSGLSFPLELNKGEGESPLNRPQTPKPPFPYENREVTFRNPEANITLAGTYSIPHGSGPFPAVILVSGSGAQDRDCNILGHKWFEVLADHLLRKGISVLRYDDRGIGASEGNFKEALTTDLSRDALYGFQWLEKQPETDPKRTGIIGHSEGGIVATMVGSQNMAVDFLVLLASPSVTGKEILLTQRYEIEVASGIPENQAVTTREIFEKVYNDMSTSSLSGEALKDFIKERLTIHSDSTITGKQLNILSESLSNAWMKSFLEIDPSDHLKQLQLPVLALYGSKDIQVNAPDNAGRLKKSLSPIQLQNTTIKTLAGHNHLFQPAVSGLPGEYQAIDITISSETLNTISQWIQSY